MLSLSFFLMFCYLTFLSNYMWLHFLFYLSALVFLWCFNLYSPMLSYYLVNNFFYLDLLSSSLIMLTLWITCMMFMCSYKIEFNKQFDNLFIGVVYILMVVLLFTFMVNNYLMFYILFEISLIPTLILIVGWGYQPERLQAGVYLMMYTLCGSLPLLIGLLYLNSCNMSLFMGFSYFIFNNYMMLAELMWLIYIMAFMVKMPMYLTHLWLPKAHVEAPVSGSMILAGVLLKLGGYGLFRISHLLLWANHYLSFGFLSVSMWGAFMTSIICIRQMDLKSLIAYSSVGHMGLLISGFVGSQLWGWCGSLCMMISHGLVSSGLFALANMSYENTSTRSIYLTKGMLSILPSMSIFWFVLSAMNMGAPPSINLLSEIMLLSSILNSSFWLMSLIALSSFLSGVYSLYMYTSTQHGQLSTYMNSLINMNSRMMSSLFLHVLPVVSVILCFEYISVWI